MANNKFYEKYWEKNETWSPAGGGVSSTEQSLFEKYLKSDFRTLDYGCGDGSRYAAQLEDEFKISYLGYDISENAVAKAQSQNLNVNLLQANGVTSLTNSSADCAICFEVFEHLQQPELALAEIYRCLKPGGVFITSVPNGGFWWNRIEFLVTGNLIPGGSPLTGRRTPWCDPHIRFFSLQIFKKFMLSENFEIKEIVPEPFSFANLPLVYRNSKLRRLANFMSYPLRPISRLAPGLFSGRLYIVAIKPIESAKAG